MQTSKDHTVQIDQPLQGRMASATAIEEPVFFDHASSLAVELDEMLDSGLDNKRSIDAGQERAQFELLLKKSVELTGSDYAFVLSPSGTGAYSEQFVKLNAAVERTRSGSLQPCYDTLANRRPDPIILSVMRLGRGIKGKPIDIGLPVCLPDSHPPIKYFILVPIKSGIARTSVMFLANPDESELDLRAEDILSRLVGLGEIFSERRREIEASNGHDLAGATENDGARHYVRLMSASLNAVVIVNTQGQITAFNPAAEKLFGRSSASSLGIEFERFIPQEFLMPMLKQAASFDSEGSIVNVVPASEKSITAISESGHNLQLQVTSYFTRLDSHVYTTFVFNHEPERHVNLPDAASMHQQFKALTNLAPVGIVQLGVDWTCEYANEMWCQLSGLGMDESMHEGWVDALHAEDVVDTLVELREALSESKNFSRNLRLQRPTGFVCWVTLSATVTLNDMGQFTGCLLALLDVTEAHEASEKLRYTATHDALTGLANRVAFLEKLQLALKDTHAGSKTALLYLDLDGFKAINDTLGHDSGDELLRKVAQRLNSAVSVNDTCARLGGDEFTIIIPGVKKLENVCDLAEKIVRGFNEAFDVFGKKLHLSTSVGIAISSKSQESSENLIKQADSAVYKAKSSGRSRWVVYTQEFQYEDNQRSELEARVRRATERREFTLVYQPQFRFADMQIVSFEALLRWNPPDIAAPDTQLLVSVLEESGLINDVGQWVLETACQQFRQWCDLGLIDDSCTISVNVSPAQLSLANFSTRLKRIMERCRLKPGQLNLEITESALIEKNSSCIRVIDEIKAMGLLLSLDDFGTGYGSLSYLTRLPIDQLKIDKSFIMAMDEDASSRIIVNSVLAMASTLNIEVVAEGIENQRTLEQLRQTTCKYGQGFIVSKALAVTALERYLVKRRSVNKDLVTLA